MIANVMGWGVAAVWIWMSEVEPLRFICTTTIALWKDTAYVEGHQDQVRAGTVCPFPSQMRQGSHAAKRHGKTMYGPLVHERKDPLTIGGNNARVQHIWWRRDD